MLFENTEDKGIFTYFTFLIYDGLKKPEIVEKISK